MANCAEHKDVKHGGWCVPCLRAECVGLRRTLGMLTPADLRLAADAVGEKALAKYDRHDLARRNLIRAANALEGKRS